MNLVKVKNTVFGEGKPKICLPVVGVSENDILNDIDYVNKLECDVIEWRIDHFEDVQNLEALKSLATKVKEKVDEKVLLITFRSFREGGVLELSDEKYQEIYSVILENKLTDMIDIELFMPEEILNELVTAAKENDIKIVMCNHDFDKTIEKEEIINRLCMMQDKGADICKIALMPNSRRDVLTLLDATLEMNEKHARCPLITMSMGGLGAISRISGEIFGSAMTFGVGTVASAPGQISVDELNSALNTIHNSL